MRYFKRLDLLPETVKALAKKQTRVNKKHAAGTLNVDKTWNAARRTKPLQSALVELRRMTGLRERCMYCGDSHGTDIEHFWPKNPFPGQMFRWANLLLCCTDCGRIKGTNFPQKDGEALLIDPTVEDPWQFLDYDPATGNLVARFNKDEGRFVEKGEKTVEVLKLDHREALAAGYQKTYRRLSASVLAVLNQPLPDAAALIQKLAEDDEYGLVGWCFRGTGQYLSPFCDLRQKHPTIWTRCVESFTAS